MTVWKDMDSAPRDGSIVMLYRSPSKVGGGMKNTIFFAVWYDDAQAWVWPAKDHDQLDPQAYADALEIRFVFEADDKNFDAWAEPPTPHSLPQLEAGTMPRPDEVEIEKHCTRCGAVLAIQYRRSDGKTITTAPVSCPNGNPEICWEEHHPGFTFYRSN